MKNYISNGRVLREEIAADIRDGVLKRKDIKELVSNPDIQKAFIGQNYSKKVSQDMWTKTYLDRLPNATVAEAFNEDYLYYLADVSEYVNSQDAGKETSRFLMKFWPVVLVVAVVVVGCIVYFAVNSNK